MRIYTYSPSIKAYVAVDRNGSTEYYDLTDDLKSCQINRKVDDCSDGNLTLLNSNKKYNDLFMPFDRIVVFACKGSNSYRLLTGYITKVQRWTLYGEDMMVYFSDTLYRLKQLFFDPGLLESKKALGYAQIGWDFGSQMYSILEKIAAWPLNMIDVSQEIPMGVQNWAREMYLAQKTDYEQSEQVVQEMFQTILSSSVALSAIGGGGISTDGTFTMGSAVGDTNAQKVWNFFTGMGFTKESTAGIMGNVQAESDFDNTVKSYKSGGHYSIGLFQTTDDTLYAYAREHGMDWTDPQCQCECVMSGLEYDFNTFTGLAVHYYSTGEWCWWPEKVTLQEFSQLRDVGLAAEMFCRVHERPNAYGTPQRRRKYAEAIYADFTARSAI